MLRVEKLSLSVLCFLEFAIWGSYLTSLGNFLWRAGLAEEIFWFYAVQGFVSLFMPALIGYVADKFMESRKVLSFSHFLSSMMKFMALFYCLASDKIAFTPLFILFGIGIAFYIPTIGISNAYIMGRIKDSGENPSKIFPKIRVFGTIGFITAMLMVNFIPFDGMKLQSTAWQLGLSATFGIALAVYMLFMSPVKKVQSAQADGTANYSSLFKDRNIAWFLGFTFLISICLQITNSYSNVYISSFAEIPLYSDSWGAKNANAIISVSQLSEALCVLLIPVAMKLFDIKKILIIASTAWMLRFGFLGLGNTHGGITALIFSMIVYGIAFDFVNVAGAIYLDRNVSHSLKNRAQSIFMFVMSGLGASVGTPLAGAIVNNRVYSHTEPLLRLEGWQESWFIFAAYAFAIAMLIYIIYPGKSTNREATKPKL